MRDKACTYIVLAGAHPAVKNADSRQAAEKANVAPLRKIEIARESKDSLSSKPANSSVDSPLRTIDAKITPSISRNHLPGNELHACASHEGRQNARKKRPRTNGREIFLRWWRFNLVGAIGIVVQLAALFVLKSAFHFNYLAATAVAVEAAVAHNFIWHEKFTWADRIRVIENQPGAWPRASEARTQSHQCASFAALRGCVVQESRSSSLTRFLRFNLTTGGISILGNLALMRVMVGLSHLNYFAADAIAIVLCSVANFLVSDGWVFAE